MRLGCKPISVRLVAGGSRHGVLDAGVALIAKPFSVSSLAAKAREVLDGEA